MKYINIQQAAEKWGITVRRVQDLCKSGAIHGATRFGRAWMIPEEAEKPADGRTRQQKAIKGTVHGNFLLPIPKQNPFLIYTDLYSAAGTADSLVERFARYPETARIVKAQFDAHRGDFDGIYNNVNHFLHHHTGFNSIISTGLMLSLCAVWKGDIGLWRKARQHIYSAPCKDENQRQTVNFWVASIESIIYDTQSFPEWFKRGNFDFLPFDSYNTARVFYAKYMYISAYELAKGRIKLKDVSNLGLMRTLPFIVEPMISQAKAEGTLIPEIYLHLLAASAYHDVGEDTKAISHIDNAIDLALPDKLYVVLVEHRTRLDNLLDERLAVKDEHALKRVKELHKEMKIGWTKIHNALLERNVATSLTVREREVAKLAAFGLSNAEIAERLHIEVSSVKRYIFSAMNKVGAEKRTELCLYV